MANWDQVLMPTSSSGRRRPGDLKVQVDELIAQQTAEWPLLRGNHEQRSKGRQKTLYLSGFPVHIHCNPSRIRSTTAKVDDASIRRRLCILCPEQLFEQQRGIAYGDEFVILCNPYPIVERHLTIVNSSHVKQAIGGRFASLLELARALTGDFVLFYNGPRCGASTPEHFHVQAVPRQCVPVMGHSAMIEGNPLLRGHKSQILVDACVEVITFQDYYVGLIVYRGSDPLTLATQVQHTLDRLAAITKSSDEPLVNLFITFDDPAWSVYLYPRSRHRPSCYFERTLCVSPASLDMAGYVVIPVESQFDSVSAERLAQVFAEVTLGSAAFNQLISSLSRRRES
jgi:ATP adenylyltransferase/5',5'''-P-1,P-4-tetraphosphate phosphorylase II